MNGDQSVQLIWAVGALVLVLSGLMARRIPWRSGALMALAWVAIFALVFMIFVFRDDLSGVGARMRLALDPEAGQIVGETLRVPMAEDGHFWVRGTVNGHDARFLIDSGATSTGLARATADAAGVELGSGFPVAINTANGTVFARRAHVDELRVGGLVRSDMPVIVAEEFGTTNVLGMNFLSKLSRWSVQGRTLILEP